MSGDIRFGLVIDGNAAAAKVALDETAAAVKTTGASLKALGDQGAAAEAELATLRKELGQVADAMRGIAGAAITAKTGMQMVVDSFVGFSANQKSAAASAQVFTDSLNSERSQFEALRASIDPAYAAQLRYAAVVREADIAVKLGSASQEEASAVIAAAALRYKGALGETTGAISLNRIQMMEGMHITREWATMWAMGIDPMRAVTMEAGRIATFFQMGDAGFLATIKGMGSGIASAGASVAEFLGPIGLAAIGLTAAGGAALYFAGVLKGQVVPSTADMTKQVKTLDGSISTLAASAKLILTPLADLRKEFGEGATAARGMYDQMLAIDQLAARQAIDKTISTTTAHFAPIGKQITAYNDLSNRAQEFANPAPGLAGQDYGQTYANAANLLAGQFQKTFGIAITGADTLKAHLDALSQSNGLNSQAMALHAISKDLSDAAAMATGPMAESLAAQARATEQAAIDAQKLAGNLGDGAAAARSLAGVDITPGLKAAADYAEKMKISVLDALTALDRLAAEPQNTGRGDGMAELRIRQAHATGGTYYTSRSMVPQLPSPKSRSGGGAQTEQNAVDKLLRSLQAEIDTRHTLDAVQQEMLKYREVLAKATDTETAAIKAKIVQDLADAKAMDAANQKQSLFASTAYDALDSLIVKGASFADVMKNVAASIEEAVLKAALLGEGPLASLFGMQSTTGAPGGLLGELASVFFPTRARGGMIYGPGSGTADQVPMLASSGEFFVNARATSQHRATLEAINSGTALPAFAAGGIVGGGSGGGVIDARPMITIENHSSAQVTGQVEETTDSSGRRSTRLVLADAVGDAMSTRGGGARKTLTRGYGLRPIGSLR